MLRHVLFDMELFADEADRENSQKRVLCLLEALTWCNQLYLRAHPYPETPLIYQSGIEYKVPQQFEKAQLPEVQTLRAYLDASGAPPNVVKALRTLSNMCGGGEQFREIPRIIENGGGDCDNVAAWRCAELRELGIGARPYITWRRRADGGMTYHVIVLWPDGGSEDPSLLLGMGGAERAADRLEEESKLGERCAEMVQVFTMGRRPKPRTEVNGSWQPQGLQDSIPFQTDDSYEDWSPTRPQAFYYNPLYKGGLVSQSGPLFNTRMRDADDLDGEVSEEEERQAARQLHRALKKRAA